MAPGAQMPQRAELYCMPIKVLIDSIPCAVTKYSTYSTMSFLKIVLHCTDGSCKEETLFLKVF